MRHVPPCVVSWFPNFGVELQYPGILGPDRCHITIGDSARPECSSLVLNAKQLYLKLVQRCVSVFAVIILVCTVLCAACSSGYIIQLWTPQVHILEQFGTQISSFNINRILKTIIRVHQGRTLRIYTIWKSKFSRRFWPWKTEKCRSVCWRCLFGRSKHLRKLR